MQIVKQIFKKEEKTTLALPKAAAYSFKEGGVVNGVIKLSKIQLR